MFPTPELPTTCHVTRALRSMGGEGEGNTDGVPDTGVWEDITGRLRVAVGTREAEAGPLGVGGALRAGLREALGA